LRRIDLGNGHEDLHVVHRKLLVVSLRRMGVQRRCARRAPPGVSSIRV
jgi:hypothetical protein